MPTIGELRTKFHAVWPLLDERTRRLMAASEAKALGYGGVRAGRVGCREEPSARESVKLKPG